jgi:hypothetical protein
MITIAAVRPNIDDNFLSRESNYAHSDHVNEKWTLTNPHYLKNGLLFLYDDIWIWKNHPSTFFQRRHTAHRREAPIGTAE